MEVEVCVEREREKKRREGEVVPKIYQKANQKSSKNQPKIDEEEIENPLKNQKIGQKSILEVPGRVLGRLGGQDRPRARAMRVLRPSWLRLGLDFGRFFGAFSVEFLSFSYLILKPEISKWS